MSTARIIATAITICLVLVASAAMAQRPNGDFAVQMGFVSLTGDSTQNWYGSGGYNIGGEYRVTRGQGDEQCLSLSYFKSSGQTLNVGGVASDNWLSGFTGALTYRKRPTYDNKLYYGYGAGISVLSEKSSTAGVTTSRNANPSPELHALAGLALSDFVRVEVGYTQFLRSVHNPSGGVSTSAGGAFNFTIGGRF